MVAILLKLNFLPATFSAYVLQKRGFTGKRGLVSSN